MLMQYQPAMDLEKISSILLLKKSIPVGAWEKVKASIVDVQMLSSDFYQIELQPNHNFRADAFSCRTKVF